MTRLQVGGNIAYVASKSLGVGYFVVSYVLAILTTQIGAVGHLPGPAGVGCKRVFS